MWTILAESASLTSPWPCSRRRSRAAASLSDLVATTGIPRPTAHRIAVALEHHGLLARDDEGRFVVGRDDCSAGAGSPTPCCRSRSPS